MSINLGIYDFFAYIIPGVLYLYAINEFFRSVGLKFINVAVWFQSGQAPGIILAIPILIVAYVVGHLFDMLAYRFYAKFIYGLRHKKKMYEKQLQYLKNGYSALDIQFEPRDWNLLFTFLRERNSDITRVIDKYQADSMMLRNIAFSTLLLTIIYLGTFFSTGLWVFLIAALGTLLISLMAINKSNQFREWFYSTIFQASLGYGTNLKDVAEYSYKKDKPQRVRNKNTSK